MPRFPIHLGLGARVVPLPEFTGDLDGYERYGEAHADDGKEGRLVSMHRFSASWDSWEIHPEGEELVVCVSGQMALIQDLESGPRTLSLGPGEALINPAGVWHTADVSGDATALFVTAGVGTQQRPREA